MRNKVQKMLWVLGLEDHLEEGMERVTGLAAGERIVLRSEGPLLLEPYDTLMRSVLITVHRKGVTRICVAGSAAREAHSGVQANAAESLRPGKEAQTVDYLFKHCALGYPAESLGAWLDGCESAVQGVRRSVETIRRHPLLPPGVEVEGYLLHPDGERLEVVTVHP